MNADFPAIDISVFETIAFPDNVLRVTPIGLLTAYKTSRLVSASVVEVD